MHSNFDEIVRNSDIGARTASRLHAITHYSGGCWTRKNKLSLFRKRIRPIYANGVIIIEDRYVFHTDQIPYRSTAATGQMCLNSPKKERRTCAGGITRPALASSKLILGEVPRNKVIAPLDNPAGWTCQGPTRRCFAVF